ncbi:Uncharacterised protein [Bordetella pertussis]|nr:Uncharacterised protein [Bordetella pertussis]
MATHSLVTMPVVIQSQKRKKCITAGCRSRPRCAWLRCRNTVTDTMVMCVTTRVNSTICHQVAWVRPPEMKERMESIKLFGASLVKWLKV